MITTANKCNSGDDDINNDNDNKSNAKNSNINNNSYMMLTLLYYMASRLGFYPFNIDI